MSTVPDTSPPGPRPVTRLHGPHGVAPRRILTRRAAGRRPGAEEVPTIAGDVDEDGEAAVRLIVRSGDELDAARPHAPVSGIEVVDPHDEADPAGMLHSDGVTLLISVCASQQQSRWCTRRPAHQPSLLSSIDRAGGCALDEIELQRADEERDGLGVGGDDQATSSRLNLSVVRLHDEHKWELHVGRAGEDVVPDQVDDSGRGALGDERPPRTCVSTDLARVDLRHDRQGHRGAVVVAKPASAARPPMDGSAGS